ncbi:MAG: hypothetical protein PHQ55_03110 [Eubacteriales bacterium]|nr:hypothetical protein [Eubacteriales bacterium]MDD3197528.1 hypothetical protein [Eubacteriales bacterium]MDD3502467.1 hypothetical protein [Eubacteriales bacterium]MDD4682144.1 hypothetical protein [Eubacteriales bacterium]
MTATKKKSNGKSRTSQSSNAGNRNRSVNRKPNSNNTAKRGHPAKKQRAEESIVSLVYSLFSGTYFGRVAVFAVVFIIMILINLLLSRNEFNTFFMLTGVEIIVVIILSWLFYLLREEHD